MFNKHKLKIRDIVLIFLLLVSFTFRLWILSNRKDYYVYLNSEVFFSVASALVHGMGFNHVVPGKRGSKKNPAIYEEINEEAGTTPYIKNSPGFPLLTALVFKIFGYTVFPLIYFQIFLTCFCFFLIYRIVTQIFNPAVGLLTIFLLIFFNTNEIFYTTTYWRDIYTFHATVISFYFFSRAYYADAWGKEKRNYFYTGLAVGIGVLVRATILFLPVFYAMSLPLKKSFKNTAIGLAIMFGTTLLCQTPWVVRNYLVFDKVILTHIGSGHSMMGGVGQVLNSLNLICDDLLIRQKVQQYAYNSKLRGEEIIFTKTPIFDRNQKKDKDINIPYMTLPYEAYAKKMIAEYRKNQPYTYFRQMLNQIWVGFIHEYNSHSLRFKNYPKWFRLNQIRVFNQIGILAILGFILTLPAWRESLHLAVIPLYFIASISMFYITGRHFIAMEFVYFTYTAYLFYSTYRGAIYIVGQIRGKGKFHA